MTKQAFKLNLAAKAEETFGYNFKMKYYVMDQCDELYAFTCDEDYFDEDLFETLFDICVVKALAIYA